MKAVYHNFDSQLYIENIPVPKCKTNEVLIRICYCCLGDSEITLISGRDNSGIDNYSNDRHENNGRYGVGYEASGIIVQTCEEAAAIGLKIGTPVSIHPQCNCGKCIYCRAGKENLCINSTRNMRMMREYITVDYSCVYPLENKNMLLQGALMYPVACAMHAVNLANITIGANVAIIGNRFISLIASILARNSIAKNVTIFGSTKAYCELALKYGASHAFLLNDPDELVRAINLTGDHGYDIVLDTSQFISSEGAAMDLLRRGGIIVYFSQANVNTRASFNFYELFWKQATIKTAYRCAQSFPQTAACLSLLDLDFFSNCVYELNDVQQAFNDGLTGKCLKPIIHFPD